MYLFSLISFSRESFKKPISIFYEVPRDSGLTNFCAYSIDALAKHYLNFSSTCSCSQIGITCLLSADHKSTLL